MEKEQIIEAISKAGVVAVIRASTAEEAIKISDACVDGGISAIELTFTVPKADKVIEALTERYEGRDVLVGAGTVMDAATARIAMLAGAQFIVSPYFDKDTVKICNRYRVPVMPGVMTITEAVTAMDCGADILKIFPADLFGPKIIKAIKGPIPYAKMIPTGGVNAENVAEWFEAGVFAVGAGSSLTFGAQTGDYEKITETAKLFIDNIHAMRL